MIDAAPSGSELTMEVPQADTSYSITPTYSIPSNRSAMQWSDDVGDDDDDDDNEYVSTVQVDRSIYPRFGG